MSLLHLGGSAGTDDKLYVEDVFSTYLYTGDGSTQPINNGIDLAGKGGLVWSKDRGAGAGFHVVTDTVRGVNSQLYTHLTNAANNQTNVVTSFNTNGYTIGSNSTVNAGTIPYVSWTFRKAPKFFDVVTWTGNGVAGRQIAHSLGCEVGMIVVKKTSEIAADWRVWHRSANTKFLVLNSPDAASDTFAAQKFGNGSITIDPTSTQFTIGADVGVNLNGATYVAYLFAHDPSADGIIQCGSFSGNTTVTLGWEPQWLMIKRTDSTGDWITIDNMRGCSVVGIDAVLFPNLSDDDSVAYNYIDFTPTGFISKNLTGTYIYTVIRRPNKVPTSGTEVYNAIARTGTGSAADLKINTTITPDLWFEVGRNGGTTWIWLDRLRGLGNYLMSNATSAENLLFSTTPFDIMNAVHISSADGAINGSGVPYINHFFKRAKGFMDIVCYTGTGVARTVNHNLGVVPELMIVKSRSGTSQWYVWHKNDIAALLNSNGAGYSADRTVFATLPTSIVFGTDDLDINTNTNTYVAYLFATCPNVSKVFSYTGNGLSLNVECGFSAGARFVLCKRTDSTGDWFVFDSVRGIISANDPHLSLNTTAAEVTTDDSIDPYTNGFTVNQNATTNLNVHGGTYIGLAIA